MDQSQLLKGILEGVILSLINKNETYGYEMIDNLEKYGFTDVSEGTLYPILTRLEGNNYIKCTKKKSPFGPIRKYYSITPEGIKYFESFKIEFKSIVEKTNKALED